MANHFKIERGIPIPTRTGRWDWMDKLEVGDSFIVPLARLQPSGTLQVSK